MELWILYLAVLIINPLLDAIKIGIHNEPIKHGPRTLLSGLIYLTLAAYVYFVYGYSVKYLIVLSVPLPFVRWLVHDLVLNKARGLTWSYLGRGPGSAALDKFLWNLKNVSVYLPILLKLLLIGASIYISHILWVS